MSFVHLHNHSYHSLLDGVPSPQDYAERASELGHSHLAITDHGNVDSALALQNSCKKFGITPVFGCEFYIVDDIHIKERGEKRNHVTVLAKNAMGWKNILHMVSKSHIEGHFYKPRIDPLTLTSHLEGIVILSGCALTFLNTKWGPKILDNLFENGFPKEDFYLEIMPHQFDLQKENSRMCLMMSKTFGFNLVATNDCLVKDTLILTSAGLKKIQNINIEDKVLTHNNEFRKVLHVDFKKTRKKIYRVLSTTGTKSVEATEDHPHYVCNYDYFKKGLFNFQWKKTTDLSHKDYLLTLKLKKKDFFVEKKKELKKINLLDFYKKPYNLNENTVIIDGKEYIKTIRSTERGIKIPKFLEIDDDFLSIIGCFIAQGHTHKHQFGFGFHAKDVKYLSLVKNYFEKFGFHPYVVRNGNGVSITLSSTVFSSLFEILCGKGSTKKHFPYFDQKGCFRGLSERQFLKILRSYADQDGCYSKNSLMVCATVSKILSYEISSFLNSLGIFIVPQYVTFEKNHPTWNPQYHLVVSGRQAYKLDRLLKIGRYNLPKKITRRYVENDNFWGTKFQGLEEVEGYNGLVFNFEVEGDQSYIADGFVVHNCHYVDKGDDKSHEVLLAVQTKSKMSDPNRWKFIDTSFYFKTRTEMAQGFRKQGVLEYQQYMQAIKNTVEVAEKCQGFSEIEKRDVCLPEVPEFKGKDQVLALKNLCEIGFSEKICCKGKEERVYRARLHEELELIIKLGFVEYFLIVWEVIVWCEENDIMTGPGRGSSAGSLICYLLNITKVDPIEYGLIFARFINPERNDLPDIDTDFEDKKRPLIKKHLQKLYGEWNVASISTFSVMRGKSALRDVSRAFDISLFDVNKAAKVVVTKLKGEEGFDRTIADAFEMFEEGKEFAKKYPEVAKISTQLEGTVRQRGQHASAVIVSGENLLEGDRMSFVNGKNKEHIVNWEKDDSEYMGLMKLDILGLNALTVLNMCRKLVEENHGVEIDYDGIDLKDELCLEEFNKGNTIGCFQLGTSGLRKFCQRVGISCFRDVVDSTSLYRPGTLHSGMADIYIKRKHGEENTPHQHKIIEEITADTYGIVLYQEQMMWIVYRLAGLEWKVVDKIRKIVGKSKGVEAFKKYEDQFVEGCIEQKTIGEMDARKLWNDLSSFGSYSFNLAHAVCYTVITFWTMYMKTYYPQEFMCSLLSCSDDKDKKNEYIEEAFRLGIDLRPPKVGKSKSGSWRIADNILYAPFIEIAGVGDKTAAGFEKLNLQGFYDKDDKKPVSQKFLSILETIDAYKDRELTDDEADRINEFLGVSLIKNKLHKYKKLFGVIRKGTGIVAIKDIGLEEIFADTRFYMGIIMDMKMNYFTNKNGDRMTSISIILKDENADCKIGFDNRFYEQHKAEIEGCKGEYVIVGASAPRRAGALVCDSLWQINDLMAADIDGLKPNFVKKTRFRNRNLSSCEKCPLQNEARAPILPSSGKNNVMIIGEAPNKEDNREGYFFSGNIGYILWRELGKYGLKREEFHVTGVGKCFPSQSKSLSKGHVKACSPWLDEEIKNLSPFFILAFGNSSLRFFNDEDKGIMKKSGKVEWSEKYGCWICWSIHPVSTLYNDENVRAFQIAIEKFSLKVKNFGFF